MYDPDIIVIYLLGLIFFPSGLLVGFTLVFVAVVLIAGHASPESDFYLFAFYSSVYLVMSKISIDCGYKKVAFAAFLMALYDVTYAFDSLVNSSTETWIWKAHENTVLILHLLIVLLFSTKFNAVVDSARDNMRKLCFSLLHGHAHVGCQKGQGRKEDFK